MSTVPRLGRPNRANILAHKDLERLGLNPIEMLAEVYKEALAAYRSGRGLTDKGDAGAQYLAVAGKAAVDLAKFKHPTLSAIAVKDATESEKDSRVISTAQAIDIMKADPFAPKELKDIPTTDIVDAMKSQINTPFLPEGTK